MSPHSDDIAPGDLWTQSLTPRRERDAENYMDPEEPTKPEPKEIAGKAKSFWPLRSTNYGLRGIHIPLTFSISGTYGSNYGGFGSGVLGSSYGSLSSDLSESSGMAFGSYGKSALAGSSYGNYGTGYPGVRIFGGAAKTGWSGWGNGKWGHYGKG
ncbi:uncharacterized protein LOC106132554 [Amyelois transitella]|uniref:uncharacterized protein LOC106132554 n=1 Tax=Amyelois transitella TaxID=680683 RepID=UPI00298F929A|nr:uncharacterized protein LOC106132554 [Amyelois transitella]